ncbi:DNA sulfur modification protein DndB [uncultured Xylophilus sp.]|uniref:DNA sulfur modification protein DndB n=1 Tax=uncultured Xylophilus sp. TaxID=296832 RepID=UPI0025F6D920|nr:DNA sulfur modification protein DndB [uncultured Xylophilus sp.]
MSHEFSFVFPAIRGVQAGREYYVSMCPLRLLPRLFLFDEEELMPEVRAQRSLNKARVPEIARYITDNPNSYTFSAITASVDGGVQFEALGAGPTNFRMGTLTVSMEAKFIVNDGQHRRAAIEAALQRAPELGDETIAVVFFIDRGLERCQQMFADLNCAVRPSASVRVLYDHRSDSGNVARHLSMQSPIFRDLIETGKSSLSARSRKLFTLSALNFATVELLSEEELQDFTSAIKKSMEFWTAVGEQMPAWSLVREGRMTSGEVRRDFIHSHAIVLQALGRVGRSLYEYPPEEHAWRLRRLRTIDWSRKNAAMWEGRATTGWSVQNSAKNVVLTSNQIKQVLDLELTAEESAAENAMLEARKAQRRGKRT